MLRYLALAWNTQAERDSAAAAHIRQRLLLQHPEWHRVLNRPGLLVLCRIREEQRDHAVIPLGERGLVLGTLFRRNGLHAEAPLVELSPREILEIERTRGRSLVDSHWGSYVLMLSVAETNDSYVLRGPLSALPCYHAMYENVHLFFSVADDCVALSLFRFSINWALVTAQVAMTDHLNGETGLNEVRALDPGACLSVCRGQSRIQPYWTPAASRRSGEVPGFREAAGLLRRTTMACIGSWTACHDAVVVMLSGGLDSSIVLACATRAPNRAHITCINFHSALLGDERPFARSMGERTRVELIEHERDPDIDLRVILRCNRTVSPVLHFTGFDSEIAALEVAKSHCASALFTGELGDDLFGSAVRHEALVEHLQEHGPVPSLIGVARDYALRRRVSVWRALRLALRDALLERRRTTWSADQYARDVLGLSHESRLASDEAVATSEAQGERFVHPWSREAAMLPAGKRRLVYALQVISSTLYESPFISPDDPPVLAPLASQPLAELLLTLPTHMHIHGGQNRALARAAFAADLSEPVLRRGSGKGGPELWIRALIERNRSFLRELLLDGILARERLVDCAKVERVLSRDVHRSTPSPHDVIAQAYIEAWLRHWTASEIRVAA